MASNPRQLFQVFLSSTYEDLRQERAEAISALLEVDCVPVGMEYFPAADTDAWSAIQRLIDGCDYYVLISAGRYGSADPQSGLSYTELEYDYATRIGVPVLSFVHQDVGEIKGKFLESTEEGRERLARFHAKVKQKLCRFYTTPHSLASSLKSSIVKLKESSPRPGWFRASLQTAGNLPIRFDLNEALLEDPEGEVRWAPSGRSILGHGITLQACLEDPAGRSEHLLVVASSWGPFGSGAVRSGWLFRPYYPSGIPDHTFAPVWLFAKNMCHAALFFKVHVQPDGTATSTCVRPRRGAMSSVCRPRREVTYAAPSRGCLSKGTE